MACKCSETSYSMFADAKPNWKMEDIIEEMINSVKAEVNGEKAIIALSGGIDSSVATAIAAKALSNKLTAVFVDHGFMREKEPEFVRNTFQKFGLNLIIANAQKRFLERLQGIIDPEMKRKIIGEEFIRVFEEIAETTGAEYLIQGTIYPDRIESGFRKFSDKIKTHHNSLACPQKSSLNELLSRFVTSIRMKLEKSPRYLTCQKK